MGLLDDLNVMVDTVKATVSGGIELYEVQELVKEILADAETFMEDNELQEEDVALYNEWVDASLAAEEAGKEEKTALENAALRKALLFIEQYKEYDDVAGEIKEKCDKALEGYAKAKGRIEGLFTQFTDDESVKEMIHKALDKEL